MIIEVIKRIAAIEVRIGPRGPRGEQGEPGSGGSAAWEDITGKPSTFPPSSHTHAISDTTGLQSALDGKAAASHTHAQSDVTGLVSALAAKADLVDGVVPTAQIPAIAITEFLGTVASQSTMLALTGQRGDWCNRSDVSKAFVLVAEPASTLANWAAIDYPAAPVLSVNGQAGTVVLGKADIGLGNVSNQLQLVASNNLSDLPNAAAARVALGVEEVILGVAQVVTVQINGPAQTSWAGEYVDIDDSAEVCRFWFTVDGFGTAPSAPSPGRLQVVAVNEGDSISVIETAILAAFTSQSAQFTASGNTSGSITVTNTTAGNTANPSSTILDVACNVTTPGTDAIARLAALDGSQLTNVTANNLSLTLPIEGGGTGQTTATAAFDALAPTTTKGDLIVHNGTDNVRLAGGTNGHVLTRDSTAAEGVKWAAAAGAGSGKVLQWVYATKTDTATVTGTTPSTVFSATITPTSSTSSIMIIAMLNCGQAANNAARLTLLRNSTQTLRGDAAGSRGRQLALHYTNQASVAQSVPIMVVDAPATTSATTYNIQMASNSTGAVYLNRGATDTDASNFDRAASTLVLVEIAP
jgi:hypothetical protein